jgi:ATP-dependent DNA ligase
MSRRKGPSGSTKSNSTADVPPPRDSRFGSPLTLSRVHWVRPELVAEVKYLTWTEDNLLRQVVYELHQTAELHGKVTYPIAHRDRFVTASDFGVVHSAMLSGTGSPLHYSDHQIGRGQAFYDRACALKVEGIVSKRVDAPYAPGNRGLWLKVKCLNREEFIVVGWTDPEGSRPWLGALLLGYYGPDDRLTSSPTNSLK